MKNDAISRYLSETLALCKTLTIKSIDSLDRTNQYIILKYGPTAVNQTRPDTWKYYLNISGSYHAVDEPMTIDSLDTLETVSFTKEILTSHPITLLNYQYGTPYYYNLLTKYPSQEKLILGILYPADLRQAIEAEDGTILSYSKSYIEPQESTLLIDLEIMIKKFLARWHIRAFGLSDPLYPIAQHAILYLQLMPTLLNLRLNRCRTNEAHSFHINSYLASHGRLDRYVDFLTLKQKLFLYRNIAYIERHPGNEKIFNWLIERLLSERYVPIADYSLRFIKEFNEKYQPNYHFIKDPLNTPYNVPDRSEYSLDDILAKEAAAAIGNLDYSIAKKESIDQLIRRSPSSVIKTKLLESSIIDYASSEPMPIESIVINQWGYYASREIYTAPVYFQNKKTNENHVLTTSVAFNYLLYFMLCSQGIVPTHVPQFIARRVRRIRKPSVNELTQLVDRSVIKNTLAANWLITNQPECLQMRSTANFFSFCERVHAAALKEWFYIANIHDLEERAYVDNMINLLYADGNVASDETGMAYSEWFSKHAITEAAYTKEEALLAFRHLLTAGAGYIIDPTKSLKNIQEALINILSQLCSYSIQFVKEINDSPYITLNWPAVRSGRLHSNQINEIFIPSVVTGLSTVYNSRRTMSIGLTKPVTTISLKTHHQHHLHITLDTLSVLQSPSERNYDVLITRPHFSFTYPAIDTVSAIEKNAIGFAVYETLTEDERRNIPDIYHQR